MSRGELFILSAPSGAGKTTLIQRLPRAEGQPLADLAVSVSHTTRPPRQGEVDGREYHFVERSVFQRMVERGEFLEWARVHDNFYGTSREEVIPRLERRTDVLLEIDVQGAEQVQRLHPEAMTIFVVPPSYQALEERLRGRGRDGPREIAARLSVSLWEIKRYKQYDYVIINDDAERASQVLAAIILQQRHRQERMRERVEGILRGFPEVLAETSEPEARSR